MLSLVDNDNNSDDNNNNNNNYNEMNEELSISIDKIKNYYLKMLKMIDYYYYKIESKMKLLPNENFINKASLYRYNCNNNNNKNNSNNNNILIIMILLMYRYNRNNNNNNNILIIYIQAYWLRLQIFN